MKFLTKYLKSSLLNFLTKLSNKESRNWKLSIKFNSLLLVKLMHFSNPFDITFVLRLNLTSSCLIRREWKLWNTTRILWFNLRLMLQSLSTESLYLFSYMTMISYFNIVVITIIVTDPTSFSWVLRFFIVFFSCHKLFFKMIFLSSHFNIYFLQSYH